jgi:tRNA pseudouridine synthase 10
MAEPVRLDDPDVQHLVAHVPEGACDACLGRTFARIGHGIENDERGRQLREATGRASPSGECVVCEGIVERVPRYVELCTEAAGRHEMGTYLVGSRYFKEVVDREGAVWAAMLETDEGHLTARLKPPGGGAPPWPAGEWLKNEVNRRVGRALEGPLSATVDFQRPDVVLTIDTRVDLVTVDSSPVLFHGRYRKLDRRIPQTRWPCRRCQGAGCNSCDGTGKQYPTSVEEEIAPAAVEALDAEGAAFHGMGREDIDALMLGDGRPFVLEIKRPRRRHADLAALQDEINARARGRVEVEALAAAAPEDVARFKAADPQKTYRARCRAATPIDRDKLLKATHSLAGVLLEQRTPNRVAHRRADKVRRRRIHELRVAAHEGDRFELDIRADSGTYIKEFVSGDDGRTAPSIAQAVGAAVRVEELDVVAIHWRQ